MLKCVLVSCQHASFEAIMLTDWFSGFRFRFLAAFQCDSWIPQARKPAHLGYKIILLCLWQSTFICREGRHRSPHHSEDTGWKREDGITKKAFILRSRRQTCDPAERTTFKLYRHAEIQICLTPAGRCWLASMITPVPLTMPIKSVQNSSSIMWPLSFHVCIKLNSMSPAYSTAWCFVWNVMHTGTTHDKERIASTCIDTTRNRGVK